MERVSLIILAAGIIIAGGLLVWCIMLKGDLKTAREATQSAEKERDELKASLDSYKATLAAIEDAKRRESESLSVFIDAKKEAILDHEASKRELDVLQSDPEVCNWLFTSIPDGVRYILEDIVPRSPCD